jgi:hypothetical protein
MDLCTLERPLVPSNVPRPVMQVAILANGNRFYQVLSPWFDWPIIQKYMKLWRFTKIEGFILRYRVHPLSPMYMDKRRTTFAKAYGIKVRWYWELFVEHVRNVGTLSFDGPAPNTKKKKGKNESLHRKSTVHCPSGKWTVDSPHKTQLETPPSPPPTRK